MIQLPFVPSVITSQVSSSIAARGRAYRSRVTIIKKEPGYIQAYVQGTHRYTTSISHTQKKYDSMCTCPYGAPCKHAVALAYVIFEDIVLKNLVERFFGDIAEEWSQPSPKQAPTSRIKPIPAEVMAEILQENDAKKMLQRLRDFQNQNSAQVFESFDEYEEETLNPPYKKNLLDVLTHLTTKHESKLAEKTSMRPKKEQKVYYVLHTVIEPTWSQKTGEKYLALEAGKADRSSPQQNYTYNTPQNLRSMFGRNPAYFTDLDRKILSIAGNIYQSSQYGSNHWESVKLDNVTIHEILRYVSQAELIFFDDEKSRQPISIEKDSITLSFHAKMNNDGLTLESRLQSGEQILNEKIRTMYSYSPPVILTNSMRLYALEQATSPIAAQLMTELLTVPPIPLDRVNDSAVITALLKANDIVPIALPAEWNDRIKEGTPTPVLTIVTNQRPWRLHVSFQYEGENFLFNSTQKYFPRSLTAITGSANASVDTNTPAGDSADSTTKPEPLPIGKRSFEKEAAFLENFTALLDHPLESPCFISDEQQPWLFSTLLPALPPEWDVYIEKEKAVPLSRKKVEVDVKTTTGIDWLDIDGTVTFDQNTLSLVEVLDQAMTMSEGSLIKLNDRYHLLSPELLETLNKVRPLRQKGEEHIRLHRTQVGLLEDLGDMVQEETLHESWRKTLAAIREFKGIKKVSLPKTLTGTLRPYQAHGVSFLDFLRETSFGGILADDMGLGKTIQAIGILALAHQKNQKKTGEQRCACSLIISPTSVVSNWQDELMRFCPSLRVHQYLGKERQFPDPKKTDIILTSYPFLWRDRAEFLKQKFHYVILDEAQYIKNASSATAKTAHQLQATHRLCLTGTPMENNLTELYSQFRFLNPGLFGSLESFKEQFVTPIEKQGDAEAKQRLRKLITPFLLRRTKKQVAKDLPPKTEQTLVLEMSPEQRALYDAVKAYYQTRILQLVDKQGIEKSQIQILEALLRLRQVCCDPQLLKLDLKLLSVGSGSGKTKGFSKKTLATHESVKKNETMELLSEALAGGHNVLLFSQFVEMLNLLADECKKRQLPFLMLTGKTKNRAELIREFQNAEKPTVFLLSLKAAGTGLNLTAADYVIHYDPWWNPAVENQATDRAHRIGQTKSVTVYKLIVKNTVEEKIQQLQEKKKALIEDIILASGKSKRLTRDDLAFLLK